VVQSETNPSPFLEKFEHVVVLMMENRSFDNVFGYLYPNGAPRGQPFAGAAGYSNPGATPWLGNGPGPSVSTSDTQAPNEPFPDPGEYMISVLNQMFGDKFNGVDYNPSCAPDMSGFVQDYYQVLYGLKNITGNNTVPWLGDAVFKSAEIMNCQPKSATPVLSALAEHFCVFDHWFCALPSATWTNRAFWHADTSYGWADNPMPKPTWTLEDWLVGSNAPTLFSRLEETTGSDNSWHIYSDAPMALTKMVHFGSLWDKVGHNYFRKLSAPLDKKSEPNFFNDCREGNLPKYSFLEPHFLNDVDGGHWHNDMHPSKWESEEHWVLWGPGGPGSITLGDQLIHKVYEAIRKSPCRDETLFIIAFDEHGGNFDHVSPPSDASSPDAQTFYNGAPQHGFNFNQLGPRVPMVMVSSHIQAGTVVNTPMNHGSFLRGLQDKWGFDSLGPRSRDSASFADALQPVDRRDWPPLSMWALETPPKKTISDIPKEALQAELTGLQRLILEAIQKIAMQSPHADWSQVRQATTEGEAQQVLRELQKLPLGSM